jgi:pimeloyl-ACP methyl ester carboxylesterase
MASIWHFQGYSRRKGASLAVEERFTAPESVNSWPQAQAHTRWPGTGQKGDSIFHQFFASQVESLSDGDEIERLNQDAGAALLDEIGAAILLVHSQSGPFGWLIADARPDLVKAIVAIEPNGPPFFDVEFIGAPDWFEYSKAPTRKWGITRIPLTFDPPASRTEPGASPGRQPPRDPSANRPSTCSTSTPKAASARIRRRSEGA